MSENYKKAVTLGKQWAAFLPYYYESKKGKYVEMKYLIRVNLDRVLYISEEHESIVTLVVKSNGADSIHGRFIK